MYSLTGALLALVLTLTGCAGGHDSESHAVHAPAAEGTAVAAPMHDAVAALADLVASVQSGDAEGWAAAYARFDAAFGQVLGPISLQNPEVARQMANAEVAIEKALAQAQPEAATIVREAGVITQGLARTAGELGTSLIARAAAEVAREEPQGRLIEVRAKEYRFTPDRFEVKAGERITVRLINEGTEPHEWEIEALDVEIEPVQPGKSVELTFTAPAKPGTYAYVCDLEDHEEQGMRSTMVVR